MCVYSYSTPYICESILCSSSVSLSASVGKLNIHGITSSEITTHLVTVLKAHAHTPWHTDFVHIIIAIHAAIYAWMAFCVN